MACVDEDSPTDTIEGNFVIGKERHKDSITEFTDNFTTTVKGLRLPGVTSSEYPKPHSLTFSPSLKIDTEGIDDIQAEIADFYLSTFKRVYDLATVHEITGRVFLEVDEHTMKNQQVAQIVVSAAAKAHKQFSDGRQTVVMIKSTQEAMQVGELSKTVDLAIQSNAPWFQVTKSGEVQLVPTHL